MKTKEELETIKKICIEKFLVPFEGTGPKDAEGNFIAYADPIGIPTIAWGITYNEQGEKIKLGEVWSYDRAMKHKSNILDDFLEYILKVSPVLQEEGNRRVAAILSWVYNLGKGNYYRSTFKKKIDAKDWEGAFYECKKWNRAGGIVLKGLTKRREAEGLVIYFDSFGNDDKAEYN